MINVAEAAAELAAEALKREFDDTATAHGLSALYVTAICERLELLTAAVERVADYVGEFESEHGSNDLRGYAETREERIATAATNPPAEGDGNG